MNNSSNESFLDTVFYKEGTANGILYFPAVKTNPYQDLFYTAVHKQTGRNIVGIKDKDFSKEALRYYSSTSKYIHIHWAHVFIDVNNPRIFYEFIEKILYAKELGYEVIWTIHNLVSHESASPADELIAYQKLAKICDFLLVHSNNSIDVVSENYKISPAKIFTVHHGSYESYYPINTTRHRARQQLGIKSNELVLLFFGSIRRYKGVDELLNIYSNILKRNKNIRLLIAGEVQDPQLKVELGEAKTKYKRIIVVDKTIPDNQVNSYFYASDVVVLPFKRLLTSGSAILAITFYKPVVAPCIGSLEELVTDDIGVLYDQKDGLVSGLDNILDSWNGNKITGFRDESFRIKLDALSWDNIVNKEFNVVMNANPQPQNVWKKQGKRILKQLQKEMGSNGPHKKYQFSNKIIKVKAVVKNVLAKKDLN